MLPKLFIFFIWKQYSSKDSSLNDIFSAVREPSTGIRRNYSRYSTWKGMGSELDRYWISRKGQDSAWSGYQAPKYPYKSSVQSYGYGAQYRPRRQSVAYTSATYASPYSRYTDGLMGLWRVGIPSRYPTILTDQTHDFLKHKKDERSLFRKNLTK